MDPALILELVGYLASLLVLISLLMSSVMKLRVINSIGAAIFTVYAILIKSYPTAVMNFALIIVNLYFLVKVMRTKKLLSLMELRPEDGAVQHFITFYKEDIVRIFPGYDFSMDSEERCWLVYADANPVGLLVGRVSEPDTLGVSLDYACPSHRDCSVGAYLYGCLKEQGIRQIVASSNVTQHTRYLQRMGFEKKNEKYIKNL
jgi:hypothetical protein